MEIIFTWSWLSFFVGVAATVTFAFWAVVYIAYKQWKKQKKEASAVADLLNGWKAK